MRKKLFSVLLVAILSVALMGCGGPPDEESPEATETGFIAPETFDPALVPQGEPVLIMPNKDDPFMQAEFYGIGDYDRLAGVETLEYKCAVYDQDGSLQFVTRVLLRNLGTGAPDMRYSSDADGYALILNSTEGKSWVRESAGSEFVVDAEGDTFASYYQTMLSEENLYLQAIAGWDGEGPIITTQSPHGSKVIVFDVNIGATIDDTVFLPK